MTSPQTLILVNYRRMGGRIGSIDIYDTTGLTQALRTLADQFSVRGIVVPVENTPAVSAAYADWDTINPCDPHLANQVSTSIREEIVLKYYKAYSRTLQYLVIVGDDAMIPFYRVPDDAYIANESAYTARSLVNANNSTYASLELGYIQTDDFYADYRPLYWRGREMVVPDLAVGRLVESPAEIIGMVREFLRLGGEHFPSAALVTGYDFLIDSAESISDTLASGGLLLTRLIDDAWTGPQLQSSWPDSSHGLASVNAHFDHFQAIPADTGSGTLLASDVSNIVSGTVNFSMGCHSGFSVHDGHAGGQPLDFAQALAQQGAWWIGNTGYGYGMDDAVSFTERLMDLFAQELTRAAPVPVGTALMRAKHAYLGEVPSGGFGTYDEKALIEATLYGLPMYRILVPTTPVRSVKTIPVSTNDLTTDTVTFDLATSFQLETGSIYGDYYSIDGQVLAGPGRPVQPRTSQVVPVKLIAQLSPRGAVLVSASSDEISDFNPLVSRPVTDTALSEPSFDSPAWFPANVWTLNQLGDTPQLVVVPAQFKGDESSGTLRRFTDLQFQVYYTSTDSADFASPIIWTVESRALGKQADFWVTAQDTSGIQQVVMAYTLDGSQWQSRDLTYHAEMDRWETHLDNLTSQLLYFIQAVDGAGNVTITANKGLFFKPTYSVFLPLLMREF